MKLLALQQRPSRAGAQTSLARLLESLRPLAVESLVLCSESGWLPVWCTEQKLACEIQPAPKARSLRGRIYANRNYVQTTAALLQKVGFSPDWIVANDTEESIHAAALAQRLQRPWTVILRHPGLSQPEFLKYKAHTADAMFAVGADLLRAARSWAPEKNVSLYQEGLLDSEFFPARAKPAGFPRRVLVAGSEQARKGWDDFLAALKQTEAACPDFPAVDFALTGARPPHLLDGYQGRCRFEFLGRVPDFAPRARQYDLAIHPSRNESFGLAPFEILAAGVPVLCSSTGEMSAQILPPELLFPPNDAAALAHRLQNLHRHWSRLDFDLPGIQQRLRTQYPAQAFARQFLATLRSIEPR